MREAVHAAVATQRQETAREHEDSLAALQTAGCEIAELPAAAHEAFVAAVAPLYEEARRTYGPELFALRP
jgi:TRAP-type C4-dicarboxylate transport system substrate-binding protein